MNSKRDRRFPERPRPSSPRRIWLFRLIALVLVPVLTLAGLELVLRLSGCGHATSLFKNIQIAAPSILGEREIFRGGPGCKIRDLTFDNVTVGGKILTSPKDFVTNEYVKDLHFK